MGGGGRTGLEREKEREEGLEKVLLLEIWPIDRRQHRDECEYKSSVRGVYGADGDLGHDKRGSLPLTLMNYTKLISFGGRDVTCRRQQLIK